jgi:hypothetical protein
MLNSVPTILETLAAERDPDLDEAVRLALSDADFFATLRDGLTAKDEIFRYNCFKVLRQVSDSQPALLYPDWDFLARLLDSPNAYHRASGAQLLSRLACADPERRFDALFDRYFDLMDDDKFMVSRLAVQSAGRIAKARADLQARITDRLLRVDLTHHKHPDLAKADVIQAFAEYVEVSSKRERIVAFVRAQADSASPKTRQAAKEFLQRLGSASQE